MKTQKVVNFPYKNFDPTAYLASVPQETILRHHQLKEQSCIDTELENIVSIDVGSPQEPKHSTKLVDIDEDTSNFSVEKVESGNTLQKRRQRLESTSLIKTPVIDGDLRDFHEHKLLKGQDAFDLKYQLYAVVVSCFLKRFSVLQPVFVSLEPFGIVERRPLHLVRVQSQRKLVLLQRQLVPGSSLRQSRLDQLEIVVGNA